MKEEDKMKVLGYEYFNSARDACQAASFVLDYGITSLDELGGKQNLVDEVLPEEYAKPFNQINLFTVDALLRPINQRLGKVLAEILKSWTGWVAESLIEREERGKKICYTYFTSSPEVTLALDMAPLCIELIGAVDALLYDADTCSATIDKFEAEGFADHLCSGQKVACGLMIGKTIPCPDAFIKQTAICDPSNMVYDWAAWNCKVPIVLFEAPYYGDERAFKFFLTEYKMHIEELEKISGNKLDEEKLREVVKLGNESLDYLYKTQELRKHIPCPDTGWHSIIDTAMLTALGQSFAFDWFKSLYEDVKERDEKGTGVVPEGKKEIRCFWGWGFNGHDLHFYDWLEEEHGAVWLGCSLGLIPPFVGLVDTTNIDTMIEGLAWRSFHWPMSRQGMSFSDLWVNDVLGAVKDYKADCLVLGTHRACKHFWPINKLMSDKVKDETGIPSLRFEFDLFEQRFTSDAELKKVTGEFFSAWTHKK